MPTHIYNKLVRDKIPRIIEANGQTASIRTLSKDEYLQALKVKLMEEVQEFNDSEALEELADVLEVVRALAKHLGSDSEKLDKLQAAKRAERGGFEKRLFLEQVTSNS